MDALSVWRIRIYGAQFAQIRPDDPISWTLISEMVKESHALCLI